MAFFFFLLITKADLQYNTKQRLTNAITEANNTVRVQEESKRHLKVFSNLLESLKRVFLHHC